MGKAVENLKSQLSALPRDERAELADFLIASLETEDGVDGDAQWEDELQRRASEIIKGEAQGETEENVFRELRQKHA